MKSVIVCLVLLVVLWLLALPVRAQTADDLVLVNVTVTDDSYRPLGTKLKKENFQVFEDKQQQEIQYFSTEDTPISLGLLLDVSASMAVWGTDVDKVEVGRRALIELLQASNPRDEVFMIAFSDRPKVIFELTALKDISEIPHLKAKEHTALLDAIYLGLDKMRDAHNARKVLFIVSDGGENQSHHTEKEIQARLKETNVLIDALCTPDRSAPTPETVMGPQLLGLISYPTGGLPVCVDNPRDLVDAAKVMAAVMRNQYVLGYRPSNTARNGRWRKIKVKLVHTEGTKARHVYARAGYYAPGEPEVSRAKSAHPSP